MCLLRGCERVSASRAQLAALAPRGCCMEAPGPARGEQEDIPPPSKRRRLESGKEERRPGQGGGARRYVPPPKRLNPGVSFNEAHFAETRYYFEGGLRKVRPYYFDFQTYCKGRWVDKSLQQVFSDEFRAQPLAWYRAAAAAGRLRLNGLPVTDLSIVLKNSDLLKNTVHRHEPPVTAQPIQFLEENDDVVVVDKPSSLPVHPCGRFRHNTVIFILGKEHNLKELHTIHRLDRMTSGVLMFAKTTEASKRIDKQIRGRQLEKEYVCRVVGEFPENEVTCEEPILVVSYKVGVCRVDPKGKSCKTVFQRLSYNGKTSVVKCFPYTGRTHQIRVHLQFLGHPIINDPIYNMEAWGPARGSGGEMNKTDEELLQALVEEHHLKQSLDILNISEEDLNSHVGGNDHDTKLMDNTPVIMDSCKIEECKSQEETTTLRCSQDSSAGPKALEINGEEPGSSKQQDEKDPLCEECKIVRKDPSPKELVMYLHALRYKGAEFDYCSKMPDWALEDWKET
uniref:Pseudouridylate synthase RPUSD2 n=1 Tax=Sphenodon punctatus TaxID=8508 RepID=A0A8D0L1W7_SPHPU